MANPTRYTLTKRARDDLGEIARNFRRAGNDTTCTPYPKGGPPPRPPVLRPVLVKKDGGATGSDGTPASWTYSIYAMSDTALATPIATAVVVSFRPIAVAMTEAPDGSFALALKQAGTWKIVAGTIHETVGTTGCGGGGG